MKRSFYSAAAVVCAIVMCFSGCGASSAMSQDDGAVDIDLEAIENERVTLASQAAQEAPNSDDEIDFDRAWFDDCVFLGDSMILGLSFYGETSGMLGNAEYICAPSLGWVNSQWDLLDENAVHPFYNGSLVLLQDACMVSNSKKAVIQLGMNDIGMYTMDETFEAADELIAKMRGVTPNVQIYLITINPMIGIKETGSLNNKKIREYNERLKAFASEHSCGLIDSWSAIANENGELPIEICNDVDSQGIHLNYEGEGILARCIVKTISEYVG